MLHPNIELRKIDDQIGYGLFATTFIPRGTILWILDDIDIRFSQEAFFQLKSPLKEYVDKYSYMNDKGIRILCWDLAKFMNHSCQPNSLSPGFDFEIAVRDIQPGEEVCTDYGSLNIDTPLHCACRSKKCRGVILPEDFEREAKQWDRKLRKAFSYLGNVPQPLWGLIQNQEEVREAQTHPSKMPSIYRHRYAELPKDQSKEMPAIEMPFFASGGNGSSK